ncbi:hypothetical protein BLA29_010373 [Euroglyphus maynei]|uniref:Uncharacterized protein n=1 Tax=Euroglyphus maynei TaxID=6958 RepID=A0A1Y3B5R3_EURMA|nr:hypothetical protein BLA29_010373 [Euroglyphus maynei]
MLLLQMRREQMRAYNEFLFQMKKVKGLCSSMALVAVDILVMTKLYLEPSPLSSFISCSCNKS